MRPDFRLDQAYPSEMATEEIAAGVYRIDGNAFSSAMNVLAISAAGGWTLVDTGTSSSPKRIQSALAALGVGPSSLTTIYLTHHHPDHIGGLPGMREWAPNAEIVAPEYEAEIIRGNRPHDPASSAVVRVLQRMMKLPVVPVNRTVSEGDPVAGFRVVDTPGHSTGHTSLLSDDLGILFTADAFGALPKRLRVGVRGFICHDPAQAKRSAEKLLEEDYRTVVFSHGPVLRDNPKERLRQIVAECRYS
jgi:glyoxylase-like metal-dependent hydrolase (beta-lactamase superfamily II)